MLDTATAEHEAAHVVVGLALGLKLRKATIQPTPTGATGIMLGYAWFEHAKNYMAHAIMLCAGVAWERRPGGLGDSPEDYALAKHALRYKRDVETGVRIADELLKARRRAHARVASELCERDLGPADVARLVIDAG